MDSESVFKKVKETLTRLSKDTSTVVNGWMKWLRGSNTQTKVLVSTAVCIGSLLITDSLYSHCSNKKATLRNELENDNSLPKTMKAVMITHYNEDLTKSVEIQNIPLPAMTENEVLVRIEYAGLNPSNWKVAKGFAPIPVKLPIVFGYDYSGTIVKIGSKIGNYKIGDKVVGYFPIGKSGKGSFVEYVHVNPSYECIAQVPSNHLTMIEAAALPLVGLMGVMILDKSNKFVKNAGMKILILGGSTAIGQIVMQLCQRYNFSQIHCTSSQEELCQSLGATRVYNYRKKNDKNHIWYESLTNNAFDVIFDCIGGPNYDIAIKYNVLKNNGEFITIAGDLVGMGKMTLLVTLQLAFNIMIRKFKSYFGYPSFLFPILNPTPKVFDKMLDVIESNKIKVIVDERSPFGLKSYRDMIDLNVNNKSRGKLVLSME